MALPSIAILPPAPPALVPQDQDWLDQLQDAHAEALLHYSAIETQILNGERGLWLRLRFEQAERRVKALTAQLAAELARAGGRA